mmetsp:Transcript_99588/g.187323  ORF Transcript_99588/g.187323 Transcript_99588/m.187323 type:complete len:221 (-) Transcript_99588:551-1213(-)
MRLPSFVVRPPHAVATAPPNSAAAPRLVDSQCGESHSEEGQQSFRRWDVCHPRRTSRREPTAAGLFEITTLLPQDRSLYVFCCLVPLSLHDRPLEASLSGLWRWLRRTLDHTCIRKHFLHGGPCFCEAEVTSAHDATCGCRPGRDRRSGLHARLEIFRLGRRPKARRRRPSLGGRSVAFLDIYDRSRHACSSLAPRSARCGSSHHNRWHRFLRICVGIDC